MQAVELSLGVFHSLESNVFHFVARHRPVLGADHQAIGTGLAIGLDIEHRLQRRLVEVGHHDWIRPAFPPDCDDHRRRLFCCRMRASQRRKRAQVGFSDPDTFHVLRKHTIRAHRRLLPGRRLGDGRNGKGRDDKYHYEA